MRLPLLARLAGLLSIGLLMGGGIYYWQGSNTQVAAPGQKPPRQEIDSSAPNPSDASPSGSSSIPAIVPVSKIVYVLPRDAIPSVDNPKFLKASEADFLFKHDLVIGVNYKGVIRAYPFKILVWHEIVNDVIADSPVAVTYCPLCQSVLAFVRIVEGRTVQFGVSGMLYNSDLVMYDRWSNTLWSQVWGKALVGRVAGQELERVPVDLMSWEDWLKLYPNTEVLSTDTGFSRAYGSDPYRGYYTSSEIWFPIENEDKRLPPKEPVWGLVAGTIVKAYQETLLRDKAVLNDEVANIKVLAYMPFNRGARFFERVMDSKELTFRLKHGQLTDFETGSEWNFEGIAIGGPLKGTQLKRIPAVPAFWFAWATFYPQTQLQAVSTTQASGRVDLSQTGMHLIRPEE